MNKSYKFKKGDAVISDGLAGEVKGIISVGGVITHLRVELIGSGAVKYFNPAKTKLIEFNPNRPSNEYLESVLKGKREEVEKKVKTKEITIDELLDRYNDTKALFEQFGDKKYKDSMNQLLKKLDLASRGVKIIESTNED